MRNSFAILLQLFLGSCLIACVDSSLDLAEGGMSGTGISVGAITGFGSIYVNGVHFDVEQAQFYRDGEMSTGQDNFSIGELVTVTGSISEDGTEGVAQSVEFETQVRGAITAITSDTSLTVIGQRIVMDDLTVLHGVEAISDLVAGDLLEISGTRDTDFVIQASSIRLLSDTVDTQPLRVHGRISNLSTSNQSFSLETLTVDYSQASLPDTALADGLVVEVETTQQVVDDMMVASQISLRNQDYSHFPTDSRVKLEGLVTTFTSSQRFQVGSQWVVTDTETYFKGLEATDIALNSRLEVFGRVNAEGELFASLVKRSRNDYGHDGQRLEGRIEAIDLTARSLRVAGSILWLDNSSMLLNGCGDDGRRQALTLEDLALEDNVTIEAYADAQGVLTVLRLELQNDDETTDETSSHHH